jgi:carbonic anhydrase
MSATDDLILANRKYAESFADSGLPAPPALGVAVLTCMDARIDPAASFGLAPGDAHVVRNAGGLATDDALRSLLISQRLLGTREVLVVHHTNCGMQTFRDDDVAADVERDTGVRPPFALGAFSGLEQSVSDAVATLRSSPFLAHVDAVRGFVYDTETGLVSEVSDS